MRGCIIIKRFVYLLMVCSISFVLLGCTQTKDKKNPIDNSPSKIGDKTYTEKDLTSLVGNTEYEKQYSSINDAILEEVMLQLSTKENKEEAKKASKEFEKVYNKTYKTKATKLEIENYERDTLMNLQLQEYYHKYIKTDKEQLTKDLKNPQYTKHYLQIIINPSVSNDERKVLKKEVVKELNKIDNIKDATKFLMMYGEEHDGHEEGQQENAEEPTNKKLENNLIVDVVSLNKYNAEGLFDTALDLKKFKYEAIGKENYQGYLFALAKEKMTSKQIEESLFNKELMKSGLISSGKLLLKLDKEEKNIHFSNKVKKEIKNNWM